MKMLIKGSFVFILLFTVYFSTAQTFKTCVPAVAYSVYDAMLDNGLKQPASNPFYDGGLNALEKYFETTPLKNEKAKGLVFRVHIEFVVSCNGDLGNFKLVSKPKGNLIEYSNELMEIVKNMPHNWKPAIVKGAPVDCYQILSFTVIDRAIHRTVGYR